MKKIIFIIPVLFIQLLSQAHPGIGIVKDSKGNIYYTDLAKVWKITPSGQKSVVVDRVHSHELYMDPQDNLYGDHLWYNGEAINTWGHYSWCLKSNGELVKDAEPTEGTQTNYSLVRDDNGNMYWVERFTETRFMKKDTAGRVTEIARGKFQFVGWLHAANDGTIYFTEGNKLQRLNKDGSFTTLAIDLGGKRTGFTTHGRNYDSYGMWADKQNNIYIAMLGAKKIQRVDNQGKVETIYFSNNLWTPTSGLFDNAGNLWIYENSVANEVRVKKITVEELNNATGRKPAIRKMHVLSTIGVAVAVVLMLLFTLKFLLSWLSGLLMLLLAGFIAYEQLSLVDIVSFAVFLLAGCALMIPLLYNPCLRIMKKKMPTHGLLSPILICTLASLPVYFVIWYFKNDLYGPSEAKLFTIAILTIGIVYALVWRWVTVRRTT